jgi:hypothetical protein
MKSKFTQLIIYANNIDRRYTQIAYFIFMLAMFIVQGVPDDGSGGTR